MCFRLSSFLVSSSLRSTTHKIKVMCGLFYSRVLSKAEGVSYRTERYFDIFHVCERTGSFGLVTAEGVCKVTKLFFVLFANRLFILSGEATHQVR